MYARGEIPCRLNHGSVKHKIAWTSPIEHIDITTLLPAFFSGLIETQHPYATIVQQGIRDLLSTHHHSLPAPLLPLLIPPLRAALSCRTTPTFSAALCALTQLAECVGEDLAPFVRVLVPPVAARVLDGLWRERCFEALGVVECQGGEKVGSVVRALCPTYSSAFHG
ncbi:parkin co-regulated protein [Powellomyces hirtus]|nr:parkin co-regulated protein [Powellomyces hirtus]